MRILPIDVHVQPPHVYIYQAHGRIGHEQEGQEPYSGAPTNRLYKLSDNGRGFVGLFGPIWGRGGRFVGSDRTQGGDLIWHFSYI